MQMAEYSNGEVHIIMLTGPGLAGSGGAAHVAGETLIKEEWHQAERAYHPGSGDQ